MYKSNSLPFSFFRKTTTTENRTRTRPSAYRFPFLGCRRNSCMQCSQRTHRFTCLVVDFILLLASRNSTNITCVIVKVNGIGLFDFYSFYSMKRERAKVPLNRIHYILTYQMKGYYFVCIIGIKNNFANFSTIPRCVLQFKLS